MILGIAYDVPGAYESLGAAAATKPGRGYGSDTARSVPADWRERQPEDLAVGKAAVSYNAGASYNWVAAEIARNTMLPFTAGYTQADDLWIMLGTKRLSALTAYTTIWGYSRAKGPAVTLMTATGVPVAAIIVSGGNDETGELFYVTYAANGTTEVTRKLLGSSDNVVEDSATRSLHLRIKLDTVAGFVQLYAGNGQLVYEFLGATLGYAATVTQAKVAPLAAECALLGYKAVRSSPSFIILANEPTYGMFVTPLMPKADGSKAVGVVSGTFANLQGVREMGLSNTDAVKLQIDGTTPQVEKTVIVDSATDIGLPANYIIKALQLCTEICGSDAASKPLRITHLLKVAGGQEHGYVKAPVYSNLTVESLQQLQARTTLLNTNPATSAAWAVADLTDLEFGLKVEL